MNYPKKIDLHMHTTVSDGTDSPGAIIGRVKEAGISCFSVTDHDAIKGCMEIMAVRGADDPLFVPGVEFSCKDEEGQYHILGYGYDPEGESIQSIVDKGHSIRMNKLKKRLDGIKEQFGFVFSDEDVQALYALDNPGKPHIGNLMVRYGYAPSKEEAIRDYLDKIHSKNEFVGPEEAVRAILGSGGVPVLAHPSYGRGDDLILGKAMEKRLLKLIGYGLQGVEAFYSGFTPKLQSELLGFADRFDLFVTAGSDYHGRNKLVRPGDTNLPEAEAYPKGLCAFLDRVFPES
ncbi:MAG: PHP domain-containing protein [Lachnospiraceae bacterium]|nr:PHP domain-containing protein [Lachnospiraceae bacterium]